MMKKSSGVALMALVMAILSLPPAASAAGLAAKGNQIWHLDSPGILEDVGYEDWFGHALAWGDFNGDGYADLAIGMPYKSPPSITRAGAVLVLYGSASGLTSAGNQFWRPGVGGLPGTSHAFQHFGYSLATGDFNGDGYADLAIGVPGQNLDSKAQAGQVQILYGSAGGLTTAGTQTWHQESPGMAGSHDDDDEFGSSLATGDFNGDGYADLAIGVPGEDSAGSTSGGRVAVIHGSPTGLTATGNQTWQEGSSGLPGLPGDDEFFGLTLATGDFNGDGYADLAVAAPWETAGPLERHGVVYIIYGSGTGLTATGYQIWAQDSPGIELTPVSDDQFGWALAAGDFNRNGYADLAVGTPGRDVAGQNDAGAVYIIHGSAGDLTATGYQIWHQNSPGLPGGAEANDQFGYALAAGDFCGNGYADLAVGVPQEAVGSVPSAGAVNVLYGSSEGLISTGSQMWHQDSPGILGMAENADLFGFALAAGDANGDRRADLAVGVPREDVNTTSGTITDAGMVHVIYGAASPLPPLMLLLE
jgi:hypothetical protein